MIQVDNLKKFLAQNVHPTLYSHLLLMTPNGTLISYSTPVNIHLLRNQAAKVSLAWKENDEAVKRADPGTDDHVSTDLEALVIETQELNYLVRKLQPNLLLLLVGTARPNLPHSYYNITAEAKGDSRYPKDELAAETAAPDSSATADSAPPNTTDIVEGANTPLTSNDESSSNGLQAQAALTDPSTASPSRATSTSSTISRRERDLKLGTLHLQRCKLDALAAYIEKDFKASGFVYPVDLP